MMYRLYLLQMASPGFRSGEAVLQLNPLTLLLCLERYRFLHSGRLIYRDMAEAGLSEPEYRQADFMLSAILKNKNWGKDDLASWVVTPHDTPHDQTGLLEFCATPRTRQEMMEFMGLVDRKHFTERYLKPLLASGKLEMTIPDKPQSKNQKYLWRGACASRKNPGGSGKHGRLCP